MSSVSIPLDSDKYPGHAILIDEEDYERVSQYRWSVAMRDNAVYATATINGKKTYLHRFILSAPKGVIVDHIRIGDCLNCTRANLRFADPTQSVGHTRLSRHSKTGYKGVHQDKNGTWFARISIDDHPRHLGHFDSPEDAAHAYDAAALRHFGEFAVLNFPDSTIDSAPPRRIPRVANSGVRGVSWNKRRRKWRAYICHGNDMIEAGHYDTIEAAIVARDKALDERNMT